MESFDAIFHSPYAQRMDHGDRTALLTHVRSTINVSRDVRDTHEIRRLLSDGKRQIEYLRNTLWMTK